MCHLSKALKEVRDFCHCIAGGRTFQGEGTISAVVLVVRYF